MAYSNIKFFSFYVRPKLRVFLGCVSILLIVFNFVGLKSKSEVGLYYLSDMPKYLTLVNTPSKYTLGAFNPITGNIYISKDISSVTKACVLAHEMIHHEQYLRYGRVGLALMSMYEVLRYPYSRRPLEVEAFTRGC